MCRCSAEPIISDSFSFPGNSLIGQRQVLWTDAQRDVLLGHVLFGQAFLFCFGEHNSNAALAVLRNYRLF